MYVTICVAVFVSGVVGFLCVLSLMSRMEWLHFVLVKDLAILAFKDTHPTNK